MSSLEIREFSVAISSFVNASSLPTEVKRCVLIEILAKVSEKADEEIKNELSRRENNEANLSD